MNLFDSLWIEIEVWIAQIINLLILFFAFKFLVWDKISKAVEARRKLTKKLENVDVMYKEKIQEAEMEKKRLIEEWIMHKDKIIIEANILWNQIKNEASIESREKSEKILKEAEKKTETMKNEVEKGIINMVKSTTFLVIKKIFWEKEIVKEQYLDLVIQDITKNNSINK